MRSALAIAAILVSSTAHAEQPSNVEVARRLFAEGRALSDQGKYIEACVLFEKSFELDPAVGTKLNLAECAERSGKPRAAWLLWVGAATEFERQSDGRAAFARQRADALEAKLATVIVRVARPRKKGLEITINGRVVEPSAYLVERTDAKRVKVVATAPDRVSFEKSVDVSIGEQVEVELPPLARVAGKQEEDDSELPNPKPWAIAATLTGVLTAGGVVLNVVAVGKTHDFEEMFITDDPFERDSQGRKWARIANGASLIVIGGAVATTVFIIKAVRASHARDRALTSVIPVIGPSYAGVQVRW